MLKYTLDKFGIKYFEKLNLEEKLGLIWESVSSDKYSEIVFVEKKKGFSQQMYDHNNCMTIIFFIYWNSSKPLYTSFDFLVFF